MYQFTIQGEDGRMHEISALSEQEALSIARESRDACDFARVVGCRGEEVAAPSASVEKTRSSPRSKGRPSMKGHYKTAIEAVHTLCEWAAELGPDTLEAEAAWAQLRLLPDAAFRDAAAKLVDAITGGLAQGQLICPEGESLAEALKRLRTGKPQRR